MTTKTPLLRRSVIRSEFKSSGVRMPRGFILTLHANLRALIENGKIFTYQAKIKDERFVRDVEVVKFYKSAMQKVRLSAEEKDTLLMSSYRYVREQIDIALSRQVAKAPTIAEQKPAVKFSDALDKVVKVRGKEGRLNTAGLNDEVTKLMYV